MAEQKFEKDLERLEQIVEALEGGGLSLDDALRRFEEGIKLARRCEKTLTEAERKIEILTKNAQGEIVAESFGDEEEESCATSDDEAASATREAPSKTAPAASRSTKKQAADTHSDETEEEGGLLF